MVHALKCWPQFFYPLKDGRKRFELRKNDRHFCVGDELILRAYDPDTEKYLDRERPLTFAVTYILDFDSTPGFSGLDPDYVILGLGPA